VAESHDSLARERSNWRYVVRSNSEQVLAEIPKNDRECLRVSRSVFNGHEGVNICIWLRGGEADEWMPTNKGVWIGREYAPEVVEALTQAIKIGARHERRE
jgi:hypothetical protein